MSDFRRFQHDHSSGCNFVAKDGGSNGDFFMYYSFKEESRWNNTIYFALCDITAKDLAISEADAELITDDDILEYLFDQKRILEIQFCPRCGHEFDPQEILKSIESTP